VEYSERIVDIVGERFDAAIRIGNLADSRLVATRLCDQYRLLCASSSYLERHEAPDRPADLVRHNCLGYTGLLDFPQWRLVQSAGKKVASVAESVRVSGSILSNDNEALLHAALKGWASSPAVTGTSCPPSMLESWSAYCRNGHWGKPAASTCCDLRGSTTRAP
jgi:DNA-binding transcriptional LysR family regulator